MESGMGEGEMTEGVEGMREGKEEEGEVPRWTGGDK